MGGGKGGEAVIPEQVEDIVRLLTEISGTQLQTGLPALQESNTIAQSLLQGQIPEGVRPVLNQATEATRSAGSEGVRATEEGAVRAGITGSQLQEALANARFAAESQTAQAGAAPFAQALQGAAGSTFALPGQGLAGLQQAGQIAGGATNVTPQTGGVAGGLGGALGGAGTGAALGTAIAPGIGTGIGALLGAGLGGFTGAK